MDRLPCTSTHQGSPKTLVPVLLARHTRRNLRAHIRYLAMYCLWVCLSVQTQESRFKQASGNLEREMPRQGTNILLKAKAPRQGTNTLSKAENASRS